MNEWPPLREYSGSRAVLMGTSSYSFLPELPAALNSLTRMSGLLTGPLCGWPRDKLSLLANEPGPGDLPDRLITSFEDVTGIALFYYVGHGQIDLDNQLCLGLVGSRTEANRRAATSLRFDAIRRAMLDSPAAMKIVILDCCSAGLANLPANSLAASPDDVLDRTAGTGAYTMAASAAYTPARYDITPGTARPQTYFTQYLIDLMEAGIPGQPSGLRLHPIFVQLRDKLASDERPVPVERSVDAAREFVFAYNAAPPEVQRDLHRELTDLTQRLAETQAGWAAAEAARDDAHRQAEARERELRTEIQQRMQELERLRARARSEPPMSADEWQRQGEAIEEAERLLDESEAAHAVVEAGAVAPEPDDPPDSTAATSPTGPSAIHPAESDDAATGPIPMSASPGFPAQKRGLPAGNPVLLGRNPKPVPFVPLPSPVPAGYRDGYTGAFDPVAINMSGFDRNDRADHRMRDTTALKLDGGPGSDADRDRLDTRTRWPGGRLARRGHNVEGNGPHGKLPWPIVTASLVLLLLLGGGGYGYWQYNLNHVYVGVQNGYVAIFRGTNQSLAGISLSSLVTRSTLPSSKLRASDQAALSQAISSESEDDAKLLIGHFQAESDDCATQWQALAAWQVKNLQYQAAVAAQEGAAHPESPPDNRGPRPAAPPASSCAGPKAFGIPASALP